MDQRKIDLLCDTRIGAPGFSRSINPLETDRRYRWPIFGFDTEYTSKKNNLLSIQLWGKSKSGNEAGLFLEIKPGQRLTVKLLFESICKLYQGIPKRCMLVTYFSLAELQFLPVVAEGFYIREYAGGSLDVSFFAEGSGTQIEIFDIGRFYNRIGLAKAAESMGLEKLEMDTKSVTRKSLRNKNFVQYALHDAYLCYEIMQRLRLEFLSSTGVDPAIQKTAASTSQAAFRKKYVREKLYCDINRARYAAICGMRGGHAEVFKRGRLEGNYTEWDFSSAYPESAVRIGEFPIQGSWREVKTWGQAEKMKGGFCRIIFDFPDSEPYPFLPVDGPDGTFFPLYGQTWCTVQEALYAIQRGAEIDLLECWGYKRGTTILSDYMAWTIEERNKAAKGSAGSVMWKLLANSLYGKFAQAVNKIPIDEYRRIADEYNLYLEDLFELSVDELVALGAKGAVSVGPVFMPEWSGLITGYARTALAQMISSGNAVYTHTDSVWSRIKPKTDLLPFEKKLSGPVTIVRRCFGAIGEPLSLKGVSSGKCHVAYHSIWNRVAALQMISKFGKNGARTFSRTYPISRPLKFREVQRSKCAAHKVIARKGSSRKAIAKARRTLLREPGQWVQEWRRGSTEWCGKRCLLSGGNTRPWRDLAEYEENMKTP